MQSLTPKDKCLSELIRQLMSNDMEWIRRREESLFPLTEDGVGRSVKFEIDVSKLSRIAETCGPIDRILVPLGWLKKDIEKRFVATVDGKPATRLTRDEVSTAAVSILLDCMPEEPRRSLSKAAIQVLFDICYGFPVKKDFQIITGSGKANGSKMPLPPLWAGIKSLAQPDKDALRAAMRDPQFLAFLMRFTINSLPTIEVRLADIENRPSCFVEYELLSGPTGRQQYSELGQGKMRNREKGSGRIWSRFAMMSVPYEIKISGFMEAQREHLRIHLPEGLQLASLPHIAVNPEVDENSRAEIAESTYFSATLGTLAIYRARLKQRHDDYRYRLSLFADLSGFAVPALLSLAAGAMCLFLLVLLHFLWRCGHATFFFNAKVFDPDNYYNVLEVLLLGSALVTGWSVHADPKGVRRILLSPPRRMVVFAMIVNVSVGLFSAVFGHEIPPSPLVLAWLVALAVNAAVIVSLFISIVIHRRATKAILPHLGETLRPPVLDTDTRFPFFSKYTGRTEAVLGTEEPPEDLQGG
ncbi:MAG: hypothetical protein FWD29_02580 [Micrococcales bacterium]|nr:hypothetical protein [Micrococcales bacterium]